MYIFIYVCIIHTGKLLPVYVYKVNYLHEYPE